MKKKKKKKGIIEIDEFVKNNPNFEFKLTNHVYNRLRQRMGWSVKYAKEILGDNRIVKIKLTEDIIEKARDAWKIEIIGMGIFVIAKSKQNENKWNAVTFYPSRI